MCPYKTNMFPCESDCALRHFLISKVVKNFVVTAESRPTGVSSRMYIFHCRLVVCDTIFWGNFKSKNLNENIGRVKVSTQTNVHWFELIPSPSYNFLSLASLANFFLKVLEGL